MISKLRYWLLPVWVTGLVFLLDGLSTDSEAFYFIDRFILVPLLLLPYSVLLLWSYIKAQKIFSLPKPGRKRFILAAVAAVHLIPLFFLLALSLNDAMFTGRDYEQLEPFYMAVIHIAVVLAVLLILRILGIRQPKGKHLFMCFLPVLLFAAIGMALILIPGNTFWVDSYHVDGMESMTDIQRRFFDISVVFFGIVASIYSYGIISFAVYWAIKYNHDHPAEQTLKPVNYALLYWLSVFVWAAGGELSFFLDYHSYFSDTAEYIIICLLLLMVPFICAPYIYGRKVLWLPALGKGRTAFAIAALLCLIPLGLIVSVIPADFYVYSSDTMTATPEPLNSTCINLVMLGLTLLLLRIVKLRLPRGKRLFACFLPVLIPALLGVIIILATGRDFWMVEYFTGDVPWSADWVQEYFTFTSLWLSPLTASVTVYEAVKYHHEQAKLAADRASSP